MLCKLATSSVNEVLKTNTDGSDKLSTSVR